MRTAIALALVLSALGCSKRDATRPDELLASIARALCFGTCPVYQATVYRDGVVEYEGTAYVKVLGKATGQLSPDQVAAIEKLFVDNHYLELADAYTDYEITDLPWAITSYSDGSRVKLVRHYLGDTDAPAVLDTIENDLDRLIGVEQWIGTKAERASFERARWWPPPPGITRPPSNWLRNQPRLSPLGQRSPRGPDACRTPPL